MGGQGVGVKFSLREIITDFKYKKDPLNISPQDLHTIELARDNSRFAKKFEVSYLFPSNELMTIHKKNKNKK